MERLRLWRYKKLTNENVKDEKVIGKKSDDEDYNSCFKLRKTLKTSCRKFMKQTKADKKVTVNDFASVTEEEKFIKKLKEQRKDKQEAEENRKTLHKCLRRMLNRNYDTHQLLSDTVQKMHEENRDAYVASGIYDKFGNSCLESLQIHETPKQEVEAEDLSSSSWYHSGIIGNFSVELLKHQSPGSFIIHKASHKSGNFILSLRVPSKSSKVMHHLIVQSKQGYRLKGEKKSFPTVASFVTHHSILPESLPVALAVHRPENLVKKLSEYDDLCSIEDLENVFTDLEL